MAEKLDIEAAWFEWRTANPNATMYEAFKYAATLPIAPQPASAPIDAAEWPKSKATILERLAIDALNEVKAWRDSDGNEGFPQSTREKVEAVLMTYEQRRFVLSETPAAHSRSGNEENKA